jgi:hypothetical protein
MPRFIITERIPVYQHTEIEVECNEDDAFSSTIFTREVSNGTESV